MRNRVLEGSAKPLFAYRPSVRVMRRLAARAFLFLLPFSGGGPARAWTDTLTAGSQPIRAVHVTELRTAIDDKRYNFGFSSGTWTDSTLTAGTTFIRKTHIDELRDKLDDINAGYTDDCPATVPAAPSWDSITAGSTLIRAAHFTQLRTETDAVGTARACCGLCRKGTGGANACADQTAGEDLWADCAVATCKTGNCESGACQNTAVDTDPNADCADNVSCKTGYCDGSSACANMANNTHGANGLGSANCALCKKCTGGACADQSGEDLWNECAAIDYCTPLDVYTPGCTCDDGSTIRCTTGNCAGGICETVAWNCSTLTDTCQPTTISSGFCAYSGGAMCYAQ